MRKLEIRPLFKCAMRMKYVQTHDISRHQHFDYELIYLEKGKYACEHNGHKHYLRPGQALLLRPGDWHTDYVAAGTVYQAINFVLKSPAEHSDSSIIKASASEKLLRFNDKNSVIPNAIIRILREQQSPAFNSAYLIEAYTLELFWHVVGMLPGDVICRDLFEDTEPLHFRKKLAQFFQLHIHQMLELEAIASEMNVSLRCLNNKCREYLGVSPMKAFTKTKMEYALDLIERTDMSIKEISEYLGYQNPYHFSKVFKRIFQKNPSSIRKALPK